MSKFTPGPWHIGSDNGEVFVHADHLTRHPIVAAGTGSCEQDIFLIASAPDLYATLKLCLESGQLTPLTPATIRAARAALAKAGLE